VGSIAKHACRTDRRRPGSCNSNNQERQGSCPIGVTWDERCTSAACEQRRGEGRAGVASLRPRCGPGSVAEQRLEVLFVAGTGAARWSTMARIHSSTGEPGCGAPWQWRRVRQRRRTTSALERPGAFAAASRHRSWCRLRSDRPDLSCRCPSLAGFGAGLKQRIGAVPEIRAGWVVLVGSVAWYGLCWLGQQWAQVEAMAKEPLRGLHHRHRVQAPSHARGSDGEVVAINGGSFSTGFLKRGCPWTY